MYPGALSLSGLLLTLLLGLGAPLERLSAERLVAEVWCELEPAVYEDQAYPVPAETAARRILEEARVYLSAMIYGYRFSYTPYDRSRRVEERFEITPIAEIPWGDSSLEIIEVIRQGNRMLGKVAYTLADHQRSRRNAWSSNTHPFSAGRGGESVLSGVSGKIAAFERSIKEAVRGYARKRVFNKPREINGEVLLWEEPRVTIDSGDYVSTVRIKLFIRELIPYSVF